ncbi:PilZ domain-containing protein [Pseudomonas tolaasii]|uniref:Cyclic diguanosine monophosphate-binding protein n=2 Tax=Pseudomonas tolaasii TaxID=29442 RepID=A0A7Y8AVT5_PSETO|nr:PilZ domain-containing protein [Pseudomonas tolaasii]ARB29042.1 PilZ domain-containing protein [Pseudomonas tolaasii]KAB0474852.1 PilZ domain-containing protein [Pseudomonas tolaasii]MBY8941065.1 PilZ domain-containing protein [Pseudomonas tolaasii]NVZ46612.1 PilZ domain-containing protein [Pseudomonas tolaasii]NWA52016.1 PilZ domain-containing protein [Pseudomonas tolaasii]
MTEQPSDRRRFRRIAFDAKTTIAQDNWNWPVRLVDVSLRGLLVERPEDWRGNGKRLFNVDIRLDPQAHIKMQVKLAHDDHGQLGFVCEHIDLDSISHLRRLIELNLGDEDELHRELGALLEL